ncbi:MAG: stage II sporulation protein E [Desulfotomaculaceae bacterium]|nr:stage II sporulation protein E [Desulfotomaculaceae bacterium]
MTDTIDVYPYHRVDRRASKGESKQKTALGKRLDPAKHSPHQVKSPRKFLTPIVISICIGGFFLGRGVVLGDLVPFGVAFVVASIWVFARSGLVSVPAVIAGLASISGGMLLLGSTLTVICTLFLIRTMPVGIKRQWLVLPGLVLAVTVIVKTSLLAIANPSSYSYFSVLFEAVFAALLTPVMMRGLSALKKRMRGTYTLNSEEIFCILLILGGLIAGTGDLRYEIISLKGTLSRLAILLGALVGGAGTGAASGAVLGVVPGLAYTVLPALAPAYSFAGFLAGFCRSFGKAGVATGFLLGNIVLSVYLTDNNNLIAILAETGLATVLFLMIPSFLIEGIRASIGLDNEVKTQVSEEGSNLKDLFEKKMKNWALIFRELSLTFEQVSSTAGQSGEEQGIQKLLSQISKKVCGSCASYRTCWEREFYKTYQHLIDLLALVEINGSVSQENINIEFRKRCTRTKELASTISCLYEILRINRYWSGRLLESRGIVSEQLRGIGEVIASLPAELVYDAESEGTGYDLRKKLKEAGARVEYLSISRLGGNKIEVSLTHAPCGGRMQCRDVIAPLLSSELKRSFCPAVADCLVKEGEQACQLRFYSDLKYRLVIGFCGIGKAGSVVSGDSNAFFYLKGGILGLAISDGMGVGPKAAMESSTTISLLRHLLELGFRQELAIKTVNSILVLRSPDESFATLDLAKIDLYGGHVNFIKIGAPTTYILHDGHVIQIRASSLPVGIIENIEVASQNRLLESGDKLIMITDGVLEAFNGANDKEDWLVKVLEDANKLPPREIAELLLKLAQTRSGGVAKIPDDMTVVVAGLEKQQESAESQAGFN